MNSFFKRLVILELLILFVFLSGFVIYSFQVTDLSKLAYQYGLPNNLSIKYDNYSNHTIKLIG